MLVVFIFCSYYIRLTDLIEDARKRPGKLSYGSAGNGSASHLATVLLAQTAKLELLHVPYRGASPALNDLMGGRLDFMVTTVPSIVSLVGKVKPLAVTTKARSKKLPDVPSIAESGIADYESSAWYGFVVPKGTPRPIIDKLRQATVDTINSDIVRQRLEAEGAEPIGNTPEQFAEMMKAESDRWAKVIKEGNITVD